jgi:hypothetical protein
LGCGRSSRSATPELHAPDCPFVRPQMAGDERDLPAELAQEDEMSFPPRREVPPPPEPQRPPTIDYTGKVADDGLHIVAYVLIILVFLAGVAVGAVLF